MLCIRARLQSGRNAFIMSTRGFSRGGLAVCEVEVTVWELIRRVCKPRLDWIRRNVGPVLLITTLVVDSRFGKALLPDLTFYPMLFAQPVRKSAFDELHRLFDCHSIPNRQKQMNMIGHNHKIVQFKSPCYYIGAKHFYEQASIPFGLQYPAFHACFRGCKKGPRGRESIL